MSSEASESIALDDEIRCELDLILHRRARDEHTTEMGVGSADLELGRVYLKATVDGGWAVPTWPKKYGGRDAPDRYAEAIARVRSEYSVPDLYAFTIGLNMVGPTLLTYGSDDQRDRWLRGIANGSEIWCQLFSEPEAGSDLANVALRAVADGELWRLNGQKLWVSRSMWARWGLLLARTDPDAPKHRGLTMFVVDMTKPGVDVRPLTQINGDRHFAEVFFDSVETDDTHRIGDVGSGWAVAMTVLGYERALSRELLPRGDQGSPAWLRQLSDLGALTDPVRRDRAIRVFIDGEVVRLTALRARTANTGEHGSSGSGAKIQKAQQYKAQAYLVKDAHGAHGMLSDHDGHLEFLTAPSMSIRGGTDEIQRNIISERTLGMPSEPRLDREIPWSLARRPVI